MQPYWLPYIGYFQLIKQCDVFVIYDNIKYTKKGWINRNRINVNGEPKYISVPIKKDSDFLNVNDRKLSDVWEADKVTIINKITSNYSKYPYFEETMPLIRKILGSWEVNLFWYIAHSIELICNHLDIKTPILNSSQIQIDHELKGKDKVKALCKELEAEIYINPIGGKELYSKSDFEKAGIELLFIRNLHENTLSIIDVLFTNGKEKTKLLLNDFQLE